MSDHKKNKLYLDEFYTNLKGLDHEAYKAFGTLGNSEDNVGTEEPFVEKFHKDIVMLQNKEIKTIIRDFYKKEYKYFVSVGVDELLSDESTADEGFRFIIFQLQEKLASKSEYESLSESETILYLILSNDSSKQHKYVYSDELANEFKNVLKQQVGE